MKRKNVDVHLERDDKGLFVKLNDNTVIRPIANATAEARRLTDDKFRAHQEESNKVWICTDNSSWFDERDTAKVTETAIPTIFEIKTPIINARAEWWFEELDYTYQEYLDGINKIA